MELFDQETETLFASFPFFSSFDSSILNLSKSLYFKYKSVDHDLDSKEKKPLVQACVYLSCLIASQNLQLSKVIEEFSQTHIFMVALKEILKFLDIPADVHLTASRLVKSYAVSLMNYKKVEELFEKISLRGNSDHISSIFQAIWLFFINFRKEIYHGTEDLAECGCIIISIFDLFLNNLPENEEKISHSLLIPPLSYLISFFRTVISQVQPFILKVVDYARNLTIRSTLKNSFKFYLSYSNISELISALNSLYADQLKNSEFDERTLKDSPQSSRLLLTPVIRRTGSTNSSKGKVINWDENLSFSIKSSLKEITPPFSSAYSSETPMRSAMECTLWLATTLEFFDEVNVTRLCADYSLEIKSRALILKNDVFEILNSKQFRQFNKNKSDDLYKFYFIVLENLLKTEKNKGNNLELILQNEKFHKALFACCSETFLYVYNISCLVFEEILQIHGITAFEFWKNISCFIQYDSRMPIQLKKHFKDLEERILTRDGWEIDSQVSQAIGRVASEGTIDEISHPSFTQYFKKLLAYSANRITEISNAVNINSEVQEEIWASFKYFLSEKTEILISRHLDQIILCSIYGVCKNNKLPVTFKLLVDHHTSLYQADGDLFTKVKLTEGKIGDIIRFYNEIYIANMKDFLTKKVVPGTPRISGLSPSSPLKANIQNFQVPLSPFLTPKTKRLYAFGEHIGPGLKGINSMMTGRKLDFDAPIKRPKIEDTSAEEKKDSGNKNDN